MRSASPGNTSSGTPGGNIRIQAQDIQITQARTTGRTRVEEKFRQSGVSVGAGGSMIEAAQSIGNTLDAREKTQDRRMQALGASAAGLQAYNAATAAAASQNPQASVGITFTLGSSSSQSVQERSGEGSRGSSLRAAGNVELNAKGAGAGAGEGSDTPSDILVRGSQITAGDTATLKAEGNITLLAAQNTAEEHNRTQSDSASVSATYNGSWSFSASAQSGRGTGDGSETIHRNTRVEAGRLMQLQSGQDTELQGAVVAANSVQAEVGGDLRIHSLQDSSTWSESNSQSGGTAGYGNGSFSGASASASRTDIQSDYRSVGEQGTIREGDGGFQIDFQGQAELVVGVVAST